MSIKRLDNRSGMIMLIAITFIIIMSIMLAGVFSRSISASLWAVNQTKSTQAGLLARGSFWIAYNQLNINNTMPANFNETIDGVAYSVVFNRNTTTDPDTITVTVTYPD